MVDIPSDTLLAAEEGFAVGDVLGRSLSLFRRDFAKFVLLTGLFLLPDLIGSLIEPNIRTGAVGGAATGWSFVVLMLQTFANVAILAVAWARMNGRASSFLDAVRESGQRYRSAIFTSILQGFAAVLGLILLIVPGLIALAMMYVALPVCVVERTGATASINRSSALTKGHRWKVFGIFLVATGGGGILVLVIETLAALSNPTVVAFTTYLAQVVYLPFSAITSLVVYQTLRTAKEGPAVDTLAEVFA